MAQLCGVRVMLGVFEAGMLPGIAYYLSRWYRKDELTFRLSWYIVTAVLAGAFGGLLACGILKLDHVGRFYSWQMIFVIEGIITVLLSVISLAILTDRPETATWLNAEEKKRASDRLMAERVGTTKVLDKIYWRKIVAGGTSPVTILTGFMFLLNNITVQGLAFFLPTIVKTIFPEETTVMQQFLTAPPYLLGTRWAFFVSWGSYKSKRRQAPLMLCCLPIMAGYFLFLVTENPGIRYAATFFIAFAAFPPGALTNAQVSANVVGDTARTGAIAVNTMLGNIGGLISTWAFLPGDAPNFPIGNGLNLAAATTMLALGVGTLWWMRVDNEKREDRSVEEEMVGMTQEEIEDLDWKHPGHRWSE